MRHLLQRLARRLGYRVERLYGPDVTPDLRRAIASSRRFTTTSDAAIAALYEATRYVVAEGIPGAFVECGVWRGGSLLVIARELRKMQVHDRELYGFDTFTGMTEPSAADVRYDGKLATERGAMHLPDAWAPERVASLVMSTGYHSSRLHLIAGPVEQTLPEQAPEQIALLRLDTDWYESTRHELRELYPRLASGGVLIVDDYGHWRGARKATDEYLATLDERAPMLVRVDYSVRIAVKP